MEGVAPLTGTKRLESQENPFLPDGDLRKETDDLLKRATIIRDKFLLQEEAKQRLEQQVEATSQSCNESTPASPAEKNQVSPGAKPKENGQTADGSANPAAVAASPEKVRVEVQASADQPTEPSQSRNMQKDKKKGNKCCSVM